MKLALSLRTWSPHVIACSDGHTISADNRSRLHSHDIGWREEKVIRLSEDGSPCWVEFDDGPPLACDALFFCAEKIQHSPLAMNLGCEQDEHGLARTGKKQSTRVEGVFLAGDADGDVQFAIVAAAEGAIAATAINAALQKEEQAIR